MEAFIGETCCKTSVSDRRELRFVCVCVCRHGVWSRREKKEKEGKIAVVKLRDKVCVFWCVLTVQIRNYESRSRGTTGRLLSHSVKRKHSTWWLISLIIFMWNGCQMTTTGNHTHSITLSLTIPFHNLENTPNQNTVLCVIAVWFNKYSEINDHIQATGSPRTLIWSIASYQEQDTCHRYMLRNHLCRLLSRLS